MNNIPQGYKQTELGIIPDDWDVTNLKSISQNCTYGVGAEATSYNGGPKYIRITDIDDNTRKYVPLPLSSPAFYSNNHIVQTNDILFARTGASVGKSYIYESKDGKLVFAGFLMRFNIYNASAKYVFYNTLSKRYNDWVLSESARTGQPGLNIKQLSSYTIPLPPLSEQQSIAEALSDVDNLIAALDKKIAKKRLIKQGAMQQLLTGKKRLPGFNEEWVEKNYGRLFTHISTRNHQIDSSKYQITGKYPIVDQGQISIVGYTDNIEPIICKQDGAIIFGDHTRIFKYVDYNFCVGADGTQVLFCKDDICTKFIYYLCNILEIPNTGYNRHYKYVKEMIYNIPKSSKEQQAIATILSDMDKEITELETQRDKYRLIKSGMMQKLLTGEIRLRKE